jgi:hypothetical protein
MYDRYTQSQASMKRNGARPNLIHCPKSLVANVIKRIPPKPE